MYLCFSKKTAFPCVSNTSKPINIIFKQVDVIGGSMEDVEICTHFQAVKNLDAILKKTLAVQKLDGVDGSVSVTVVRITE